MSDAIKMRHLLAVVYGDQIDEASYVLFEIYRNEIAMAMEARKLALSFDASPVTEGYTSGTVVQTPSVGGEFVLRHLPEWLSEWVEEQGDRGFERVHLLPIGLHGPLENLKTGWSRNEHGIRWGSRNCRFACDKDTVRLGIDDKYTDDITIWTRGFLPILEELTVNFGRPAMSCDLNEMVYEEEVLHG